MLPIALTLHEPADRTVSWVPSLASIYMEVPVAGVCRRKTTKANINYPFCAVWWGCLGWVDCQK